MTHREPPANLHHAHLRFSPRRLRISLALTGRLTRLKQRLTRRSATTAAEDPALIWAAVAVLIAPDPDAILLIRRADRQGDPWSGHMALPGGRREAEDPSLLATVIRETGEEVGIELLPEQLVGSLDDVVPRNPVLPPIAVRPFVFVLPQRPALLLNPEVAATQWVTLDNLLEPQGYHLATLEIGGQSRDVQAYRLADAIVWGMTERILTDLLDRMRD